MGCIVSVPVPISAQETLPKRTPSPPAYIQQPPPVCAQQPPPAYTQPPPAYPQQPPLTSKQPDTMTSLPQQVAPSAPALRPIPNYDAIYTKKLEYVVFSSKCDKAWIPKLAKQLMRDDDQVTMHAMIAFCSSSRDLLHCCANFVFRSGRLNMIETICWYLKHDFTLNNGDYNCVESALGSMESNRIHDVEFRSYPLDRERNLFDLFRIWQNVAFCTRNLLYEPMQSKSDLQNLVMEYCIQPPAPSTNDASKKRPMKFHLNI